MVSHRGGWGSLATAETLGHHSDNDEPVNNGVARNIGRVLAVKLALACRRPDLGL